MRLKILMGMIAIAGALALGQLRSAEASASSLPAAQRQSCDASGKVVANFGWIPSHNGSQWLDLSLANNDFLPGSFVSMGPLAPSTGSFAWRGLDPGKVHYARINTLTSSGWASSDVSILVTKACWAAPSAQLAPTRAEACDAATLQWGPGNPSGSTQWLDISLSNNGFAAGTFVSVGPLASDASSFYWSGLAAGRTHYWRVNTWTGSQWTASATGAFKTPCGTSTGGNCDSAYSNVCLSVGTGDWDCAGGTGNGPNYVSGPFTVSGPDPFGLDADGDGIACEAGTGGGGGGSGGGNFIPYPGNGGGPTRCRDGTYSHSSGRGTCSHHGGVA